jgi:hypothetical protein
LREADATVTVIDFWLTLPAWFVSRQADGVRAGFA